MSNYMPVYRFTVDAGFSQSFGFQDVSGMSHSTKVATYVHGAMIDGTAPIVIPGRTEYGDITMKKGFFKGNSEVLDWLQAVRTDHSLRRTIIVTLLDEQRQPVKTWTIEKAFPSKLEAINLSASSDEIAVESMTISHEGYTEVTH